MLWCYIAPTGFANKMCRMFVAVCKESETEQHNKEITTQVRDNKLRKYKRKDRNFQFKLLQILLKYFVFNYDVLNRYISASYLKIYIVRLIVRKLENASKQVGDIPQKRVRVKPFGASDKMIEDCEESDFEMGGEFDVEELDVEEELEVGEELDVEQSQASTSSSQYTRPVSNVEFCMHRI